MMNAVTYGKLVCNCPPCLIQVRARLCDGIEHKLAHIKAVAQVESVEVQMPVYTE
jgi:hypothetical protein